MPVGRSNSTGGDSSSYKCRHCCDAHVLLLTGWSSKEIPGMATTMSQLRPLVRPGLPHSEWQSSRQAFWVRHLRHPRLPTYITPVLIRSPDYYNLKSWNLDLTRI